MFNKMQSFCIQWWEYQLARNICCSVLPMLMPWIEDMKQTWEVSSQQCECGRDLSQASSVFGIGHQWDSTRSPALNPHQISKDKITENLAWRGRGTYMYICMHAGTYCRHILTQTSTRQIKGHALTRAPYSCIYCTVCPQGGNHRCKETLNRSYKLQRKQRHSCCCSLTIIRVAINVIHVCGCLPLYCRIMSSIGDWPDFPPCPERSQPLRTTTHEHTWKDIKSCLHLKRAQSMP